ncbi:hypothetical protein B0H15DRAFT_942462 [Mycena belliarum]|uniref:Fungal-type protein kinase domain-containing protein n=1 Tax=Mycena belliarum TaxID=1033014 RepID=A0AAD6UM88_9AGAR|nr:hypothetical protein B0H15DRAFT_942462 [Mycena belliae]
MDRTTPPPPSNPMNNEATPSGTGAAPSVLGLYEATASEQRGAYMQLLQPGREPAHVASLAVQTQPFVLPAPLDSESTLLQSDPEYFAHCLQTLESTPATGVAGGPSTAEHRELQSLNSRYCDRHFDGRVVRSPLEVVLARLGSRELAEKLVHLTATARPNIDENLKQQVLAHAKAESDPSSKPEARSIDGRYWLVRLADTAAATPSPPLAVTYAPTRAAELPAQQHLGYLQRRKCDAALRPAAAAQSTIANIMVNVEFTQVDPPSVDFNPLIGASAGVTKYRQAILNAHDLLTCQPTRLFVPTLSFHGKGEQASLFVSILSQERLELAVIENCFSWDGLPTVAALLHLFRSASLYQLGYNPLFVYAFTSPPPNFLLGDAIPTEVAVPGAPGVVRLNGNRLSQLCSTPFGRATLVLQGELEETDERSPEVKISTPVVVKLCYISERRQWREKVVVDALYAADPTRPPAYAPKLLAAFGARTPPPIGSGPSASLPGSKRKASTLEEVPAPRPRHLEVMLFASPPNGLKLPLLSAAQFLSAAEQLLEAILDAFRRRVLHRDVSVNNILFADTQLLLIDWEIGSRVDEPWVNTPGNVIGTLDTMSGASLANDTPLPHDDVESAVYVLLKVLTQRYVPSADSKAEWEEHLEEYCWDDPSIKPRVLKMMRYCLWTDNLIVTTSSNILRLDGHDAYASLISSLLALPLPARRWDRHGIDSSDYDAVLSSLEVLVERAVAIVRSVDASSLEGNWELGPR